MKLNKLLLTFFILFILFLISLSFSTLLFSDDLDTSNKIVFIPVQGFISISSSDSFFSEAGASSDSIVSSIEKANKDPSVKAIVLEINSPGGNVVASREIANAVKASNKPVVSWIREVGASGAYWVASSSDYIIADDLSMTGSIGVIMSYLEFSDLMEKYGVKYEEFISGNYKSTGSPYKETTLQERIFLQNKINLIQKYFVDDVKKNRNLNESKFSDASFYLGVEAKEIGLVDELGGKEQAISKAKQLANITEAKTITYESKKSLFEVLSQISYNSFFSIGEGIGSVLVEKQQPTITL